MTGSKNAILLSEVKNTYFPLLLKVAKIFLRFKLSSLSKSKPSLKTRTANAIFWVYFGIFRDYDLKNIYFMNQTFLIST